MTKTSRLLFSVPVAALMASPAVASTFFQFTYTFDGGSTLVGASNPGQNAPGSLFLTNQLTWTFNGNAATLLTGTLTNSSGNTTWNLPETQSTFTVSPSAPFSFTRTGTASNTAGGGIVAWEANGSFFSLANDTGALRGVTLLNPGEYQVQSVSTFNVALDNSSVALVPEINGSGFAYIAFILGALGLWLYSGAGRTRQEETPAVA